jgi:LmeA-like phospholipid-binding
MADWWPFDRSWADELKRNWTEVLNMSSAAAQSLGLPQPGFLAGDPFSAIVDAARTWLVGKRRTIRFAGHELTMVLTDISVEGSDLARAIGQYGQVRFTARDVHWGGHQFERVEVQARNVHLRPGTSPVLVVAPVLVETFVAASVASRWLATVSSRLELTLRAGIPQVGLAGAPWVRLEVEAVVGGGSLRIQPRALRLRERRLSLRSPAFHLPVPDLPSGFVLTSVEPAPGGFVMRGMLSEWQRSVARNDIERLLAAMRGGKDDVDL